MPSQHRRSVPGPFAYEMLQRPHLAVGAFPGTQQPQRERFHVLTRHIRHEEPAQIDLGPALLGRLREAGGEGSMIGGEFLPTLEEGNLWIRATMPSTISLEAGVPSVAIVPVGMTRFRERLPQLRQSPANGGA